MASIAFPEQVGLTCSSRICMIIPDFVIGDYRDPVFLSQKCRDILNLYGDNGDGILFVECIS